MTGFLVVLLPILVVVGAFTWLQPSKRDQALAKLRSDALINGFRIGSLNIPDLSEYGRINQKKRIVTIYQKQLNTERGSSPHQFIAVRTSGECGIYLPEGWDWAQRTNMDEGHCKMVGQFLSELPESVEVLALSSDSVSLSWDEADPSISFDRLATWLVETAESFALTVLGR